MNEESLSQEELVSIINNTDKRYQYSGKDYILILKDEPLKPCTIYVSDCEEAIWYKVVDLPFFVSLKKQLQLASPLKVFTSHFVKSLQNSSFLEKDRSILKITIKLEIGEGLMMSSSIKIQSRVHYNNPDNFKLFLRKFMTLLWDVKHSQLKKQKEKEELQQLNKQKEAELEEEEQRKIKSGYSKKAGNNRSMMIKKGDLMNPERKRRKKLGAKLGTGFEQDTGVSRPTPTPPPSLYAKE